jgi:hypothetical protein
VVPGLDAFDMLERLDDAGDTLVVGRRRRDWRVHERRSIMSLNAIGPRRDAGIDPGSSRAVDGLRAFDGLSRTLASRRDAIVRGMETGAAYPQPTFGSPAAFGTAVGAAVAAFVGSEAGRAAIDRAVAAASGFLKGALGKAASAQLPLPFE